MLFSFWISKRRKGNKRGKKPEGGRFRSSPLWTPPFKNDQRGLASPHLDSPGARPQGNFRKRRALSRTPISGIPSFKRRTGRRPRRPMAPPNSGRISYHAPIGADDHIGPHAAPSNSAPSNSRKFIVLPRRGRLSWRPLQRMTKQFREFFVRGHVPPPSHPPPHGRSPLLSTQKRRKASHRPPLRRTPYKPPAGARPSR